MTASFFEMGGGVGSERALLERRAERCCTWFQRTFHLNTDEIRTKGDESWCRQSVKKVLSNELYVGTYRVADYESHIEAYRLISDDLFEEATATRYRFQDAKGRMDDRRKLSKAERILDCYKNPEENAT